MLNYLSPIIENWQAHYSDTPMLQTAVSFVHLGGLLLGGGVAVATDAVTLRASRSFSEKRTRRLHELHRAHFVVLCGLAAIVFSGVLIFAADVDTYLTSPAFWIKMTVVLLLLANGMVMRQTSTALRRKATDPERGWRRLRWSALLSYGLWFTTVLAGVALVNLG